MFKIYQKETDFREPNDQIYYLLASNGLFQVKRTKFFTSSTLMFEPNRGKKLGWLESHEKRLRLHLPKKIPSLLIKKIVAFFQQVHDDYNGAEAIVLVYWDEKSGEYNIIAPEQIVGRATLPHYRVGKNPAGLCRVGTIHSHGSLAAFHSGVDHKDEENDDGIHITIGNINFFPSFACSIVCDGERFTLNPKDVIEIESYEFPTDWLTRVRKIPKKVLRKVLSAGTDSSSKFLTRKELL